MVHEHPTSTVENWKPVVGWEGFYEVSDKGGLRHVAFLRYRQAGKAPEYIPRRPLRGWSDRHGYKYAYLKRKGEKQRATFHRLVLEAFVGPCPAGMEGCHYNADPSDNRLENLRWDSHKNNLRDRARTGTLFYGIAIHCAKLTESDVRLIRASPPRRRGDLTKIAERFNVSHTSITNILARKTWKQLA